MIVTDTLPPVTLFIPKGAASFVNIYTPCTVFDVVRYTLSVPYDHPDCLIHMLPFRPVVHRSGYVTFKSKFPPEVDVRGAASMRWLVSTIEENKARNRRDTFIFEAHPLELELSPFHWDFHGKTGTSYGLNKVTILKEET